MCFFCQIGIYNVLALKNFLVQKPCKSTYKGLEVRAQFLNFSQQVTNLFIAGHSVQMYLKLKTILPAK